MIRLLLAIIFLLSGSIAWSQVPDSLKIPDEKKRKLVRNHFFDPYYDWQNPEINSLLLLSGKKTKVGNVFMISGFISTLFVVGIITGPIAITIGSIIRQKGRKLFWQATHLRNEVLTYGQKYSGSEAFRTRNITRWFYRKNFHVQYYDGSSPVINENLLLCIQHRQMAKKKSMWMAIFGTAGLTLAYVAGDNLFANVLTRDGRTDRNVWLPMSSSIVLGLIGLRFFSASAKANTQAYRHLEIATYQWYKDIRPRN